MPCKDLATMKFSRARALYEMIMTCSTQVNACSEKLTYLFSTLR